MFWIVFRLHVCAACCKYCQSVAHKKVVDFVMLMVDRVHQFARFVKQHNGSRQFSARIILHMLSIDLQDNVICLLMLTLYRVHQFA